MKDAPVDLVGEICSELALEPLSAIANEGETGMPLEDPGARVAAEVVPMLASDVTMADNLVDLVGEIALWEPTSAQPSIITNEDEADTIMGPTVEQLSTAATVDQIVKHADTTGRTSGAASGECLFHASAEDELHMDISPLEYSPVEAQLPTAAEATTHGTPESMDAELKVSPPTLTSSCKSQMDEVNKWHLSVVVKKNEDIHGRDCEPTDEELSKMSEFQREMILAEWFDKQQEEADRQAVQMLIEAQGIDILRAQRLISPTMYEFSDSMRASDSKGKTRLSTLLDEPEGEEESTTENECVGGPTKEVATNDSAHHTAPPIAVGFYFFFETNDSSQDPVSKQKRCSSSKVKPQVTSVLLLPPAGFHCPTSSKSAKATAQPPPPFKHPVPESEDKIPSTSSFPSTKNSSGANSPIQNIHRTEEHSNIQADFDRLEPRCFLNDNIIELGLEFWKEDLQGTNHELLNQIYIFGTFFFDKFGTGPSHWFLVIIYQPGMIMPPAQDSPTSPVTTHASSVSQGTEDETKCGDTRDEAITIDECQYDSGMGPVIFILNSLNQFHNGVGQQLTKFLHMEALDKRKTKTVKNPTIRHIKVH
ncbi:hypothetical protein GYMLUDRAFT_250936 [Collybiopsis luxurians FD-317 M1]|uniref:Unplaced genomic scaffold GYMLUscaffold_89, whole genome shotgun sequence n=1 Tax=Collybiopsis luxurians FD-317 M1 TaxID=944289 RepID=A0A0D0CCY1_9AGAR|nr:hypothetical protein GYMLUDRAFT_250936 [Collybiopsis luxurians FD-317 M1]